MLLFFLAQVFNFVRTDLESKVDILRDHMKQRGALSISRILVR